MTRYAFDAERSALTACWGTGRGDVAQTVAAFQAGVAREQALELASALTALSRFAWRTYTHPASAAGDPEVPNSEAWQRAQEREALAQAEQGLRKPHLPSPDGMMIVSYSPIIESAHTLGRLLHALEDADLLEQIEAEIRVERAAIEAAELGDLSGRAQQAVELSRPGASPVQVQAADALLRADPLGSVGLFTELDPAAASVAAAHWLQAAADVTAERTGYEPTEVLLAADDIEALRVQTPTVVLHLLNTGHSPRQVVTDLIADAMAVAEGRLRDLSGVVQRLAQINQDVDVAGPDAEDEPAALLADVPASLLDPARPAVDLLEDLLEGIRGCWLLYREEILDQDAVNRDREDLDDEQDEEDDTALNTKTDTLFTAEVRAEAAAHHDRLL